MSDVGRSVLSSGFESTRECFAIIAKLLEMRILIQCQREKRDMHLVLGIWGDTQCGIDDGVWLSDAPIPRGRGASRPPTAIFKARSSFSRDRVVALRGARALTRLRV